MIKVNGFCPMGCGETLAVDQYGLDVTGRIYCRNDDCPNRLAVDELLADAETKHVARFGLFSFDVKHPLRERIGGDLFECTVHEDISELDRLPVHRPGIYRCEYDQLGDLVYEEVQA
jgi:hypothetical protein